MSEDGRVEVLFSANMAGFISAVNKATNAIDRTAAAVEKASKKIGKDLREIGAGLTFSVTAPIVAAGIAAVKAADRGGQLSRQLELAGIKAKAALKPIGDVLVNVLKDAVPYLTKATELIRGMSIRFAELSPATQKAIIAGAAFLALAGPTALAVGGVVKAIELAAAGVGILASAVGSLVPILVSALVPLAAITAALSGFAIGEQLYENFKGVQEQMAAFITLFQVAAETIRFAFEWAFEAIRLAFANLVQSITSNKTLTNFVATALELGQQGAAAAAVRGVAASGGGSVESVGDMTARLRRQSVENLDSIVAQYQTTISQIGRDFQSGSSQPSVVGNAVADAIDLVSTKLGNVHINMTQWVNDTIQLGKTSSGVFDDYGKKITSVQEDLTEARKLRLSVYPQEQLDEDLKHLDELQARMKEIDPTILDDATMQLIRQQTIENWMDKLKKDAKETFADKLAGAITDFSKNASDAFADLVVDGEASFSQLAKSFEKMLVSMISQQLVFEPLFKGLGTAIGGQFGTVTQKVDGKALGGAYINGREVHAFARGGVVNSPTLFPFARGIGLMGEAGPEAIMPLQRINGRLGVNAAGAGTTVIVENYSGQPATVQEDTVDGNRLYRVVIGAMNRALTGGELDRAMAANYGVSRRARP